VTRPDRDTLLRALSELEQRHRERPLGNDLIEAARYLRALTKPVVEDYPEPPSRDIDTSLAAAESIKKSLNAMQTNVLKFITGRGDHGATYDEVVRELNMKPQTASARVRELRARGRIAKSNKKRPTQSGRQAVVYTAICLTDPPTL
jgi:predicted Rossmann fold nucleotide-binding protein DprA/Smf involved in DNA uptake